jgi:hypothetical protein
MTAAQERMTATKIIHTAFPNDTSTWMPLMFSTLESATTTSAISIANIMLDKRAVVMVRMRENIEKACEARKREVRKDAVAKPAAIGCRMRMAMSPFWTACMSSGETLRAAAK